MTYQIPNGWYEALGRRTFSGQMDLTPEGADFFKLILNDAQMADIPLFPNELPAMNEMQALLLKLAEETA